MTNDERLRRAMEAHQRSKAQELRQESGFIMEYGPRGMVSEFRIRYVDPIEADS